MQRALSRLGRDHTDAAFAFCEKNPSRCTYIAGWLHDGGLGAKPKIGGWLLGDVDADRRLHGLVYVSETGIVVPAIDRTGAIEDLAQLGKKNPSAIRVIVGPRTVVGSLWDALEAGGMIARNIRNQLGYVVTRETFRPTERELPLTVGTSSVLDQLVGASAAMALEEANDDPQSRNPELFRARIEERVARGRDFIHQEEGRLVFKSNVSALSPLGGQVEGIYTIPARRRRGIGRAGTAAVTRWVLERAARAFLLVNDDNEPAKAIYTQLGYREVLESRTIFIA